MNKSSIQEAFLLEKVAGIVRARSFEEAKEKSILLKSGGLKIIELAYEEQFFTKFIEWSKDYLSEIRIGAASLITLQQAKEAIDSGANFLVSPIANTQMIDLALQNNLDIIPGAFSPTEIADIIHNFPELSCIKLFPSDSATYFRNTLKVFPNIDFLISSFKISEIESFINYGAKMFVVGSYFTDDHNLTVNRIKRILDLVHLNRD
ncbi:MAG: bifunctional 4-hydroxy-2-oxoglutarate aldolase/2-dehydro-3-deoxy-phosphogluconate aldolase [Candidatus Caenarcaniphilales bacterium]|nr:bifunctional 4-hydroxy-2-oxoglutarate aldolase/2-dehydro-3-deoxy-phosphogluconate aldolase [Candidatus Caenarcaniphilales bacterium]